MGWGQTPAPTLIHGFCIPEMGWDGIGAAPSPALAHGLCPCAWKPPGWDGGQPPAQPSLLSLEPSRAGWVQPQILISLEHPEVGWEQPPALVEDSVPLKPSRMGWGQCQPWFMALYPSQGGMGAAPSPKLSLTAPCPCPVSTGSPAQVPDPPEPGCHHVRVRLPPAPARGRALLQALRTFQCPLCSVGMGTGPCTPQGGSTPPPTTVGPQSGSWTQRFRAKSLPCPPWGLGQTLHPTNGLGTRVAPPDWCHCAPVP